MNDSFSIDQRAMVDGQLSVSQLSVISCQKSVVGKWSMENGKWSVAYRSERVVVGE